MPENSTHPSIVKMVISTLAAFAFLGLAGTIYLVIIKADAALIAVVSGLTGTALGMVGSVLNKTDSAPQVQSQSIETTKTNTIP